MGLRTKRTMGENGAIKALTNAVVHASACASKAVTRSSMTQQLHVSDCRRAFRMMKSKVAAERASECGSMTVLRDGINVFKKDPMAQWRGEEAIGSIERMLQED